MQAVGFNLAYQRDHEELVAHGGEEVCIGGGLKDGGVRGVIVTEDVVDGARKAVANPVVASVLMDEELGERVRRWSAVWLDDREDDAHADEQRKTYGKQKERKDELMQRRVIGMGTLQGTGGHAGEQGDAEGGLGVNEADGVLRVFDGVVKELETAAKLEDFLKLRQVVPRMRAESSTAQKEIAPGARGL